jgi:deoxyribodipyrimidine photo-lyase
MSKINVFWMRRDLRLHDNTALFQALQQGLPVLTVYIFDTDILNGLPIDDARVSGIHHTLEGLDQTYRELGSSIKFYHSAPTDAFEQLIKEFDVESVFTNHDYEPYAKKRDCEIGAFLLSHGIQFYTFKDQVIFEKNEIVKDNRQPYVVFTPYMKKWKEKLKTEGIIHHPSQNHTYLLHKKKGVGLPSLQAIGFKPSGIPIPSENIEPGIIEGYHLTRDIPAMEGTSRLGFHLRFGSISIRDLVEKALLWNDTYLNELIWREFYMSVLWHFPYVVDQSFKKQYDRILWRNNEMEFDRWKNGTTGYPLVDAGMRQLNATGFMPNRLRMVTASFLTKNLLIDWRWGEAYFAEKLLDYELASNNGGWQWAAGTGVDAAPYFRVFNPQAQTSKFDPEYNYIKKWVPEFNQNNYPQPVTDFNESRKRALQMYKSAWSA